MNYRGLLVPLGHDAQRIDRHAMVSRDASREAARAVGNAMPLLRHAARVDVVSWNEGDDESLHESQDALGQWLVWHGATARVRVEPRSASIAGAMLSHAADAGADLIVMRAYRHARWTERVLGGATRGLLGSMTVPVLMSH